MGCSASPSGRRKLRCALGAIAPVIMFAVQALGAGPRVGGDEKAAKEFFRRGQVQYKLGRFAEALDEFSKAYEAAPLPAFLFNIGQCQRQLGNHERAVFFLEGYLRDKPKAKNRVLVEKLLEEERQLLAAAEAAKKAQEEELAREEQRKRDEEERLRKEREEQERLAAEQARQEQGAREAAARDAGSSSTGAGPRRVAAVEPVTGVTAGPAVEPAPPFYTRLWFWGVVGGVAVGAAAGVTAFMLTREPDTQLVMPEGSLGTLDRR